MTYISLYGAGDTSTLCFFLWMILALGAVCAVFGIIVYLSMVFCCKKKFDDDNENERFRKDERAESRLIEYNLKMMRDTKSSELEMSEISRSKSSRKSAKPTASRDPKRVPLLESSRNRSRTPTRTSRMEGGTPGESRMVSGGEPLRFLSQVPDGASASSRPISRASSSRTDTEEARYIETFEERDGRLVKVVKKITRRKKPKREEPERD